MGLTPSGASTHEVALDTGARNARTRQRLAVTGRTALHATARMVHAAQGGAAGAAVLGLVAMSRAWLLASSVSLAERYAVPAHRRMYAGHV